MCDNSCTVRYISAVGSESDSVYFLWELSSYMHDMLYRSQEAIGFINHICKRIALMKDTLLDQWMVVLPISHFVKQQSEPFGKEETIISWDRDHDFGLDAAKQKALKAEK